MMVLGASIPLSHAYQVAVSEDTTGSTESTRINLRHLVWSGQTGQRSLGPLSLMPPVLYSSGDTSSFLGAILAEAVLCDNL